MHPDLATVVNMIAKHMTDPSKSHIDAAKRAAQYIKGTKYHGIVFHSNKKQKDIEAYIKVPIVEDTTAMCDANWCPQNASVPKKNTNITLELFKTRLISGLALWHYEPIHWVSKRQSITAHSARRAKYATWMNASKWYKTFTRQ
eukprot:11831352-Ditylum_brightwellii.AAC.1